MAYWGSRSSDSDYNAKAKTESRALRPFYLGEEVASFGNYQELCNSMPSRCKIRRRQFLGQVGSLAVGAVALSGWRSSSAQTVSNAAQVIAGKDSRLQVLEAQPAVLETPLALLAESQVTPIEYLFVRNNQQPEQATTTAAWPNSDWQIELTGLVNQPRSFPAALLTELEAVEREMVVQCSGNSRAFFSKTFPIKGTAWGRGGMGNVLFRGVPLHRVLDRLEVKIDPRARFVAAEGLDGALPGKADFEHSLPLDDLLQHSLLATHLNGQPLPAVHGGPVRLVTPGVFATMHIKWLNRLRFESEESTNYHHAVRYRVPHRAVTLGTPFTFTLENSRSNWWMNVKSVVLTPEPGARLMSGTVEVRGVAFNDGAAKIDSVLVSTDQGQSWRRAELEATSGPYAWTTWRISLKPKAGPLSVWTRAIDAWGRSQPIDGAVAWNPEGYEWNGVEKIDVMVI